jgi:hypothetical protein
LLVQVNVTPLGLDATTDSVDLRDMEEAIAAEGLHPVARIARLIRNQQRLTSMRLKQRR